jgi:hypothetical protein
MRGAVDRATDRVLGAVFEVGLRSSGPPAGRSSSSPTGSTSGSASRWPPLWLFYANTFSTLIAGMLGLAWFVARAREANARHLVEWTTDIRLLDSTEFEWLVGELYRRL